MTKLPPESTTNLRRHERVEDLVLQPIDEAKVTPRLLLFLSKIQRRAH